ncbi:MAG: glycosyltransferase family 4 protein [Candidatus Aegiribacteria sp.]|nr:glycosyltransferase family 4 protein [Candidatus Aegiribacteria sp.]
MKIFQIINGLQTGGAEKLVMDLHRGYLNCGEDSTVISLEGSNSGWSEEGLYSLGLSSPYDPRAVTRLTAVTGKTGMISADIIHSHLFPTQFYTAVFKKISHTDCMYITTEHSTRNRRRGTLAGRLIDRWQYSVYDRIFCVSRGAEEELCGWIPELVNRTEVIYNGIDLNRFCGPGISRRAPPFTIVSIGSLREKKNYTKAIEAFSILRERVSFDIRYVIAGEGVLVDVLKEQVKGLGLESNVKFLGHVEDVVGLLNDSDIFFMPSSSEGFGIAAVEAMASGLPVVASDIPGIGEIVGKDERCGLLVSPESPDQMADALQYLLKNRDHAYKMGSGGLVRAADFSIERTVEEHLLAYRDVLNEGVE